MKKSAVVVGGASLIGQRAVERFLGEGWNVWSLDTAESGLRDPAALGSWGTYGYARCDVRDPRSIAGAFAKVRDRTDSLDAIVYTAGATFSGSLDETTPEGVETMIGVNLKGPWLCVHEALPLLRRNATTADPARVVLVGSNGPMDPRTGNAMYSATKAAAHVVAQILAVELAPSGITVNVVSPGLTDTPMEVAASQLGVVDAGFKPTGPFPMGRLATSDDIVDAIQFLVSGAAKYVNGAILPVDGGEIAAFVKR